MGGEVEKREGMHEMSSPITVLRTLSLRLDPGESDGVRDNPVSVRVRAIEQKNERSLPWMPGK